MPPRKGGNNEIEVRERERIRLQALEKFLFKEFVDLLVVPILS